MPVPTQCQALSDEIEELKGERTVLQAELRVAPVGLKSYLALQIKGLTSRIKAKGLAFDACRALHGDPPAPSAITSWLTGVVSVTTNRNFSGEPFLSGVTWELLFDGPRTQMFLTAPKDELFAIDTTADANQMAGVFGFFFSGTNITTIRKTGGGNGSHSKATGMLVLPLQLKFDHSRDVWFVEEDSDLSVVLATTSPLAAHLIGKGVFDVTGTGVFSGGFLNGATCTMTIEGTMAPAP